MKQLLDFERYNPFRRPDWRFERVLGMIDQNTRLNGKCGRVTRFDDQFVRELKKFLLKYRNVQLTADERKNLGYEFPGLYWAYQAYEQRNAANTKLAEMMEARILAGMTNEEIAKEHHTLPDTVHWYEMAFFNVRERLESHDWIIEHVLMPAYTRDRSEAADRDDDGQRTVQNIVEPFFDSTLKFFAYYGGPFVLDVALTGFRRGALARSTDEAYEWFDRQTKNGIRHKTTSAAAKMPVNRYNVMELLTIHTQIMAIEKNDINSAGKNSTANQAIEAMLREIPWTFGKKRLAAVKGTMMEPLEISAAEPRDSEMQLLNAGIDPGNMNELVTLQLPAPQQPKLEQETPNANAQQSS